MQLYGAFSWEMTEEFGKINLHHFRKYYSFTNGVPSDDTIRLFEMMCPDELSDALKAYFTKDLDLEGEDIAIE